MTVTSARSSEPGFAARIRTETATAHEETEHAPFVQDLLGGRLPLTDYARLAVQHLALYRVLEARVAANTDPVVAPFLAPELARVPALEADLEFLTQGDQPVPAVLDATEAYSAHLRVACAEWPGALLAHHYVRYLGDLSGGQIVGRVLQRIYGFDDDRGTSFYRFPTIPSARAFKVEYRRRLDELPWSPADQDRLVAEGQLAFRLNADIFYELGSERAHPAFVDESRRRDQLP